MGREVRKGNGQLNGSLPGRDGVDPPKAASGAVLDLHRAESDPVPPIRETDAAAREMVSSVFQPSNIDDATSLKWPQANELDKVAAATVAVSEGADSASGIAESLDVVNRQGSYYGAAAESLGLVERVNGETPARWQVTGFGQVFLDTDQQKRNALLADAVRSHPAVREYDALGEEGVMAAAEADGLSPETAERRAATARTWSARASEASGVAALERQLSETASRAPEVAARLRAEREAARRVERVAEVCDVCFIEKSTTGVCFC